MNKKEWLLECNFMPDLGHLLGVLDLLDSDTEENIKLKEAGDKFFLMEEELYSLLDKFGYELG